jgi:D-glycero-D-manno-heptose 1,7-bisphosphate phosphatase
MRLLILDRDGVINEDRDDYVKSADEWVPIPGSMEAIARLHRAGWRIAVATNQSGLARGLFDMNALNAMHHKMHELVARAGGRIDAVFFCPHGPDDGCTCRKPLPGLFRAIGERFGVDLGGVPVVGDSVRDVEGAVTVGATPYLVLTGKGTAHQADPRLPPHTQRYADLAAIAALLAP